MSETPFFPKAPFGLPAPLQPTSEQDTSELLRAMEEDEAWTKARQEAYGRVYQRIRERLLNIARRMKARETSEDLVDDVVLRTWKNVLKGLCGLDEVCMEA